MSMECFAWPGEILRHRSVPGYLLRRHHCEWGPESVYRCVSDVLILTLTPLPKNGQASLSTTDKFRNYVSAGDVALLPAGTNIQSRSLATVQDCRSMRFEQECFSIRFEKEQRPFEAWEWRPSTLSNCLDLRSRPITQGMRLLAKELDAPGFATDTLIDSLCTYIGVELSRSLLGLRNTQEEVGGMPDWQVKRIRDYIYANLSGKVTVSEIAQKLGISRRHLSRSFRRATGTALHDYIGDFRLKEAKRLLCDTTLPIKAIASQTGFSASSAFCAAFQGLVGMTPTNFRREFRTRTLASHPSATVAV